jgi:hypothetical protein
LLEIDSVHLDHTDTDKLLGHRADIGVETSNLLVEVLAVGSGNSPEDDQEWLARPLCFGGSLGKIVVYPIGILELLAIKADRLRVVVILACLYRRAGEAKKSSDERPGRQ